MRRTPRKVLDRSEAERYRAAAEKLLETAQALSALDDDVYANGLGIVAIHAAIAMCDAVTIRVAGMKSTSGEHEDAADLLADAVRDVPHPAMRGLSAALQAKSAYSYLGRVYHLDNARALLTGVETFFVWARVRLQ